jgi:hypothetical protein
MPINDSRVENAPWPVAMARTSYFHLGSNRVCRTAAVLYLYFLTGTCKHHDIGPFAYLQHVLHRLPSHPADQLDELPLDDWFASQPSARRKRAV